MLLLPRSVHFPLSSKPNVAALTFWLITLNSAFSLLSIKPNEIIKLQIVMYISVMWHYYSHNNPYDYCHVWADSQEIKSAVLQWEEQRVRSINQLLVCLAHSGTWQLMLQGCERFGAANFTFVPTTRAKTWQFHLVLFSAWQDVSHGFQQQSWYVFLVEMPINYAFRWLQW